MIIVILCKLKKLRMVLGKKLGPGVSNVRTDLPNIKFLLDECFTVPTELLVGILSTGN